VTVSGAAAAPAGSAGRGRLIDHGAIVAGWVGIGMAVTVGVSFLLVIPIEPIYWLLAPLCGLLIGYYANQRSLTPPRAWRRTLVNALYAGLLTGLTLALLLLVVKALFFYADNGFGGGPSGAALSCQTGPDCVYARYLAAGRGPAMEAAGVKDVGTFGALYWQQQLATAGLLLAMSTGGGILGGVVYGLTRPKAEG
jgi:hypothetical protein